MVRDGFSMIELLIYSTLSVFLVVIVLNYMSRFERFVIGRSGRSLYLTNLYAGMDSMVRDCAAAPADPSMWTVESPDKIMWKNRIGVLGFAIEKNKLIRIFRSIDPQGRLRGTVSSMIVNDVQGFFAVEKSKKLISAVFISLTVQNQSYPYQIEKRVYLNEGVIS